jgi:peptidoglycan/LPS O-acetylase OafA/YrhL
MVDGFNDPSAPKETSGESTHHRRLEVLDGWRAISILLVLATHMLPLGPRAWSINTSAGVAGMALFFTLSGFLIVTTLYRNPSVPSFLIRRLCRIVPLTILATMVYLITQGKSWEYYPAHLLFYLNYDASHITEHTVHFWSLCIELQFYALAATLAAVLGVRGLLLLPVVGLAVTIFKVQGGHTRSNMTHLRADEIMAGAVLALIWNGELGSLGRSLRSAIQTIPTPVWAVLYFSSCLEIAGPMRFLRPSLAGALVGSSLLSPERANPILTLRAMRYIAEISFALYVIHPLTMYGWLGSGNTVVRYLKRPICFLLTFALAHLSTFSYERRWIALGKRWARRWELRRTEVATAPALASPGETS